MPRPACWPVELEGLYFPQPSYIRGRSWRLTEHYLLQIYWDVWANQQLGRLSNRWAWIDPTLDWADAKAKVLLATLLLKNCRLIEGFHGYPAIGYRLDPATLGRAIG